MGYSFGGGAAFQLAAQHPALVRRLVLVSTPYAQSGFFPEMLPQQAAVGAAMAERDEGDADVQVLCRRRAAAATISRGCSTQWASSCDSHTTGPTSVKQLTMPVMLVYGDADMIRPEHIVSFYQLLGGGLKDAGWMREHMSKNRLADPAESHALRDRRRADPGRPRCSRS